MEKEGKINSKSEMELLDIIANEEFGTIHSGWENLFFKKREFFFKKINGLFPYAENVLEMGCIDGYMTEWLSNKYENITVIDGSSVFLSKARERIKNNNVEFILTLFEDFQPGKQFDLIFMIGILEHVEEPISLLKNASEWLLETGKIIILVPNGCSIHRLIGVKMKLLDNPFSFNSQDIQWGHKRIYSPFLLKDHIQKSNLSLLSFSGLMIKPLSNRQIEEQWSEELIDAFLELGDDFPELCSEIFAVVKKP